MSLSLNTYGYVDANSLTGVDSDGLANSGPGGKAGRPDHWWRPCNKTQESECKASCASRGREYESCAVRMVNVPGVGARHGGVSCSCKDPEPAPGDASKSTCGNNCQRAWRAVRDAVTGIVTIALVCAAAATAP